MLTASLLSEVTDRLTPLSDTPALDASVLIAHIIDQPRTWVIAHPELTLTHDQQSRLKDSLMRLERGESFPYVLGYWEFFGLKVEVSPEVLIPRPETELLVERGIAWLQRSPGRRNVADVGTGSGVIAISIATHVPRARVLATDISFEALAIARRNALRLAVADQIDFVQCDLLPRPIQGLPAERQIDLLCANLPYIPTATLQALPIYGREPTLALDGGHDGLDQIRRLLQLSPGWLAPRAMMLLEIESTHSRQALDLAREYFPEAAIKLNQDLAGRDRLLEIQL